MRLYVPLTEDEFERLVKVATAERRRPVDQAAVFIAEALARLHGEEATAPPADDCSALTSSESTGDATA